MNCIYSGTMLLRTNLYRIAYYPDKGTWRAERMGWNGWQDQDEWALNKLDRLKLPVAVAREGNAFWERMEREKQTA
jgi:hypothetical protein